MVKKTTLNVNVHVNDETVIKASRVPSADTDFVSLNVGFEVSLFLFDTAQAKLLADAAVEAFRILSQVEADVKAKEFAKSMNTWGDSAPDTSGPRWGTDTPDWTEANEGDGYFECGCTPTTNCWEIQEHDYYSVTSSDCTEDLPCDDCLMFGSEDDSEYEPF